MGQPNSFAVSIHNSITSTAFLKEQQQLLEQLPEARKAQKNA